MANIAAFKAAGLPAVPMSQFKVAAKAATAAARSIASSGGLFLRLGRDGLWVYGPDSVEVQEGSQWAINPYSMAMGFCAWGKDKTPQAGTLLGERMALFTDPPVTPGMLHDVGVEWSPQVQFDAICLTGEDVGTGVRYKAPSVGGRRAFAGLTEEVSRHADGDGLIVPVVVLTADSYQHKTYGKTFVPVFEVVKWLAPDDTTLGVPAEDEAAKTTSGDAPAEPPQPARRPAATAAASAETPAPTTRRSRRGPVTDVKEEPEKATAAVSPQPSPATVDRGAVVRRRRASV